MNTDNYYKPCLYATLAISLWQHIFFEQKHLYKTLISCHFFCTYPAPFHLTFSAETRNYRKFLLAFICSDRKACGFYSDQDKHLPLSLLNT